MTGGAITSLLLAKANEEPVLNILLYMLVGGFGGYVALFLMYLIPATSRLYTKLEKEKNAQGIKLDELKKQASDDPIVGLAKARLDRLVESARYEMAEGNDSIWYSWDWCRWVEDAIRETLGPLRADRFRKSYIKQFKGGVSDAERDTTRTERTYRHYGRWLARVSDKLDRNSMDQVYYNRMRLGQSSGN